jgi:2-hydroxychromene-2-carboxylate isomerase
MNVRMTGIVGSCIRASYQRTIPVPSEDGMALRFWFDVVCPYAAVASRQVEALAEAAGTTVDWRPILLGGVLKAHGTNPFPMAVMPEEKRAHTLRDISKTAAFHGMPLAVPAEHPRRTVEVMRLLAALSAAQVPAAARALFDAYWVYGLDVSEDAVLAQVLAPLGLDPTLRAPEVLRANTAEAVAAGVFGVPTFQVAERLHWGVDRLAFVRDDLGLPRSPPLPPATVPGRPVEVFYDFASPFAYLGVARVAAIAAAARSPVTYTPILLGALFRELGTPDVPLHTFSAARQAWMRRDLRDHAERYGVPFHFATTFPLRTVLALRVAIREPAAREPLFRAAWVEDRDLGRPEVVAEVLREAGLDPALITAADGAREALRANTERARAMGLHGVPTFVVDGERFWGQDRLDQVELALRRGAPLR